MQDRKSCAPGLHEDLDRLWAVGRNRGRCAAHAQQPASGNPDTGIDRERLLREERKREKKNRGKRNVHRERRSACACDPEREDHSAGIPRRLRGLE